MLFCRACAFLFGVILQGITPLLWWSLAVLALSVLLLILAGWLGWRRRRATARYEALFAQAPGALLLMNEQLRVIEANAAAGQVLRQPPGRLAGRKLGALLETEAALEAGKLPSDPADEPALFEGTAAGEDGTTVHCRVHLRRIALDERSFFLAALCDVTEEKRAYRQLQAFHRRTLNDLPIEAAVLTPNGEYLYANPRMIPGSAAQEWIAGKTDFDYCKKLGLHPEIALRRRAHRRRALANGKRVRFEEALPLPSGGASYFNRYYTSIPGLDGAPHAVVCFGVETTELRAREAAVAEARRETENFARLKENFLENVGHEFRTPLTSIIGMAQILAEEGDEEQQEFARMIERNGRRLMNTLGAMLDLGRLQAEGIQLSPRVLNLVREVKDVASGLQEMAEEKDIFLRVKAVQPDALAWLDQAGLYRVLHSLIGNAVKFTESGGVVVEVGTEDGQAHVRVIDTGVGIRRDYLPHLFAAFDQESGGLERSFEGVGVGLAITKRLLDTMNGTLTVDSEKGEGSMFSISFPEAFRAVQASRSGSAAGARRSDSFRVLVAERHVEDQKLLRHILEPHLKADIAGDLSGALEHAGRRAYDAVLLDVGLEEDRTSDELLEEVRSTENGRHLPIIAIDRHGLPGGEEQFHSAGYDGSVSRPLDKVDVLNTLAQALLQPRQARKPAEAHANGAAEESVQAG